MNWGPKLEKLFQHLNESKQLKGQGETHIFILKMYPIYFNYSFLDLTLKYQPIIIITMILKTTVKKINPFSLHHVMHFHNPN